MHAGVLAVKGSGQPSSLSNSVCEFLKLFGFLKVKISFFGASRLAQRANMVAAKPDNVSRILGTNGMEGGHQHR